MLKLLWTVLLVCLSLRPLHGFNTLRTESSGLELAEVVPVMDDGDGHATPYEFSALLYSLQHDIEGAQPAEGLHLLP